MALPNWYCVLADRLRETLASMGMNDANESCSMNKMMQLRKVVNHPFLFGEPKHEGQYLGEVKDCCAVKFH